MGVDSPPQARQATTTGAARRSDRHGLCERDSWTEWKFFDMGRPLQGASVQGLEIRTLIL